MARIPKAGDPLVFDDFDMILSAIEKRKENFPEEPAVISMGFVMFNIGDRFTSVTCMGEEAWTAVKSDVPNTKGEPQCPNGHPLTQGATLKLGWVEAKD